MIHVSFNNIFPTSSQYIRIYNINITMFNIIEYLNIVNEYVSI